jgi:hypothetical protein
MPAKKILMLVGDYVEDYEAMVPFQEPAQRMLADYDARTPGQLVGEPLDLTTPRAYWRASLVFALCQLGSGGRDGGAAIQGLAQ